MPCPRKLPGSVVKKSSLRRLPRQGRDRERAGSRGGRRFPESAESIRTQELFTSNAPRSEQNAGGGARAEMRGLPSLQRRADRREFSQAPGVLQLPRSFSGAEAKRLWRLSRRSRFGDEGRQSDRRGHASIQFQTRLSSQTREHRVELRDLPQDQRPSERCRAFRYCSRRRVAWATAPIRVLELPRAGARACLRKMPYQRVSSSILRSVVQCRCYTKAAVKYSTPSGRCRHWPIWSRRRTGVSSTSLI